MSSKWLRRTKALYEIHQGWKSRALWVHAFEKQEPVPQYKVYDARWMQKSLDGNQILQVLLADLKQSSRTRDLEKGKQAHAEAVEYGHESNIYVRNALINMYAKCGSMDHARRVFDSMNLPNVVSWTTLIMGYADNGQGLIALDMFKRMKSGGPAFNSVTFVAALKACIALALKGGNSGRAECRERGKEIHHLATKSGCDSDVYVQNILISMYSKCGSIEESRQVFDSMMHPNVVSWTALIMGYAVNGQGGTALDLFTRMKSGGPTPTHITMVAALQACTSLGLNGDPNGWVECKRRGKEIHEIIMESGFNSNIYVQSSLIDMYVKCGSLEDACQVFNSMKDPDVVCWTSLINGYADHGQGLAALDLFTGMKTGGPTPDSFTFVAVLKACITLAVKGGPSEWAECRERGKEVHKLAIKNGYDSNVYVQNTLIDMYSKCGSIDEARWVFDSMKHPNVLSFTVLILGYAENGQGLVALDLFTKMICGGPSPDSVTFSAALKACSLLGELEFGRTIHSGISRDHLYDVVLVTCLVDFYAKCGSMVEAQGVFDLHSGTRALSTWNALLGGFSNCGDHENVFGLFKLMQDAGFQPDSVTFLCVLACCSHGGLLEKGKECFDAMSTKYGIIPTVEHCTCMVDIFGRSKKLDDAMALLHRMPCCPNDVTWMTILGSCYKWKNVEIGRLAFQSSLLFNGGDSARYVLMGQIYGSRGMLQEQEMVMEMREKL